MQILAKQKKLRAGHVYQFRETESCMDDLPAHGRKTMYSNVAIILTTTSQLRETRQRVQLAGLQHETMLLW